MSGVCPSVCAQAEKLRQAGQLSRKEFIQMIGRTSSSSVLRCQGLDLRAMDLSHLDLQSVNFSHADLRHCNLSGANLSNCCMEYANLEGGTLDVSGFMTDVTMNIVMICHVGCPSWPSSFTFTDEGGRKPSNVWLLTLPSVNKC